MADFLIQPGLGDHQKHLLDLVDRLRHAQIATSELPQIAVVGQQSAGKSSVLRSVTGIPFAQAAGVCTRFPMEINLRRDPVDRPVSFSIRPDSLRPASERNDLAKFHRELLPETSFEEIVQEASELLCPKGSARRFAPGDVLVVEKLGPAQPRLTLIDLPGLVQNESKDHTLEDIRLLRELTDKYMRSKKTLILAVVEGSVDYVQADILTRARHHDPKRTRTMGVLTKPDLIPPGLVSHFHDLLMGRDPMNNFQLGWSVISNPKPDSDGKELAPDPTQLEILEREFFAKDRWPELPPDVVGAAMLAQKLSVYLGRHIGRHIKSLREQIRRAGAKFDADLVALGPACASEKQMRVCISKLFRRCDQKISYAVHGFYINPRGQDEDEDEDEEDFYHEGKDIPISNLRARVRAEAKRFEAQFAEKGRFERFTASASAVSDGHVQKEDRAANQKKKTAYVQKVVMPLLTKTPGLEMGGDSNSRAPYILFRKYASSWEGLAEEYSNTVAVVCDDYMDALVKKKFPPRRQQHIRDRYVSPATAKSFTECRNELRRLLRETKVELPSNDDVFCSQIREWEKARAKEGPPGETPLEAQAHKVLEQMLLYYEVRLPRGTDLAGDPSLAASFLSFYFLSATFLESSDFITFPGSLFSILHLVPEQTIFSCGDTRANLVWAHPIV